MSVFNSMVVVGAQWGDEGKGKIVNYLSIEASAVVRYQGGNNAGHTIYLNGTKFALNHIPSGILNPKVSNYIAQGCVVNPKSLVDEIEGLKKLNFDCKNLFISDRVHVILPYHIAIDTKIEEIKSLDDDSIGTTKRGIGPCYEDKYGRIGIRMIDFIDEVEFIKKLDRALAIKNKILKGLEIKQYTSKEIFDEYWPFAQYLKSYVLSTSMEIEKHIRSGQIVLFEGAQGVMLCIDNGTYPFVTSSSPSSASVALGTGINPKLVNKVVVVTKAYTTRVGAGEFPTEILDEQINNHICEKGNEYGTVTKRRRRVGWLDTVLLNHSYNICGADAIALTLLDVLDEIDEIKICHSYTLDGKEISFLPSSNANLKKVKGNFITMPGWKHDISKIRKFDDLPENAKNYIKKIEELTKVKVKIVSVGPNPEQTFIV